MKTKIMLILLVLVTTLLVAGCAPVQEKSKGKSLVLPSDIVVDKEVSYGNDPEMNYDVFYREDYIDAPVVVLVHGGKGQGSGKRSIYNEMQTYFDLGFVVMVPEYRNILQVHDFESSTESSSHDVACSLATFRQNAEKYGADPKKVIYHGYSGGGTIGSNFLFSTEFDWLDDCDVSEGDLSIKGFIGESTSHGVYHDPKYEIELGEFSREIIGTEELIDELNEEYAWDYRYTELGFTTGAVNYLDVNDPPVLQIQGTADTKSNPNRTISFKEHLDSVGIENHIVFIEGGDHTMELVDEPLAVDAIEKFALAMVNDEPFPF